jgi:Fe2+ transport system protein B
MILLQILAHAGEQHGNTAEAVTHYASPWFIAFPIFLGIVVVIFYFVWLISGKKLDTALAVIAPFLLIAGFTLYNLSSAISVVSITAGIIILGLLAFSVTSDDKHDK